MQTNGIPHHKAECIARPCTKIWWKTVCIGLGLNSQLRLRWLYMQITLQTLHYNCADDVVVSSTLYS